MSFTACFSLSVRARAEHSSVQFKRVAGSVLRSITGELNNQSVRSVYERLAQLQSGLGKPCLCVRWGSPYGGRKMHSGGMRYECIASGQFKNAAISI